MTQVKEKMTRLPDVLKTVRLTLRRPAVADKADIVRAINNLNVTKWLSVVPHPYSDADADDFLRYCAEPDNQNFAIEKDGVFCGVIGLDEGNDLGFWLSEEFWGQGIMSEAAAAVVDAYFQAGNTVNMVSGYVLGNRGSERIHENLGFVIIGEKSIPVKALGESHPGAELTLSRADWQKRRA